MAKTNKECYTCSTKYYYCPTCPSTAKKETYYNMFCSERCSKIFKLLSDETFKRITISECKEQLLGLNVSTDENFKESIKNHVQRVLNYIEPRVDAEIVEEEIVVEPEVVTTTLEEIVEEASKIVTEVITEDVIESTVEETVKKKMDYVPRKRAKRQNSEVD